MVVVEKDGGTMSQRRNPIGDNPGEMSGLRRNSRSQFTLIIFFSIFSFFSLSFLSFLCRNSRSHFFSIGGKLFPPQIRYLTVAWPPEDTNRSNKSRILCTDECVEIINFTCKCQIIHITSFLSFGWNRKQLQLRRAFKPIHIILDFHQ